MYDAPNVGNFFAVIRYIIRFSPLWDLLYLNFAVMLCFCVLKKSDGKEN